MHVKKTLTYNVQTCTEASTSTSSLVSSEGTCVLFQLSFPNLPLKWVLFTCDKRIKFLSGKIICFISRRRKFRVKTCLPSKFYC